MSDKELTFLEALTFLEEGKCVAIYEQRNELK